MVNLHLFILIAQKTLVKMNKLNYSVTGLIALVGLFLISFISCNNQKEGSDERPAAPNFIFIAVDDLNTFNSVLGDASGVFLEKIYPDSMARKRVIANLTPNLHDFASQAVTFTQAYCASPLCGPSRTALLSGVPPHISGYYAHEKHFRHYESLAEVVTLPEYLRKNGYYTAGIGKVFHKPSSYRDRGIFSDWPDRLFSWNGWVDAHAGTGPAGHKNAQANETLSKYWEQGERSPKHYTRFGKTDLDPALSNDYSNAELIAELILDGRTARTDIHGLDQELELPADQPWFLACGLFAPHLPWVAAQQFYDRFPQEEMAINRDLLEWVRDDLKDLSPTGKEITASSGFTELLKFGRALDGDEGDLNAWKEFVQAYLATIAFSDHCLGVLFDAVNQNSECENTVVILWSDHGYHLGDKNREGKTTLWEASNHCNLMIADPRKDEQFGKECHATVSLQDLYPTIAGLAGLDRPGHVHGYDLAPLLEDPGANWDYPVLSTFREGNHTIRTAEFRFLRFANGDMELYNIQKDPFEQNNLVNEPEYAERAVEMNETLDSILALKPTDY